ncbi:MAG: AAA family ATPase [Clostridium sp.]|nr:AAA family ATPase [Clostridium sp.]
MESKEGKIIAVWGSVGSGKTTLSSQLALALAEKNKEVLVVYTDNITPVVPVLIPSQKEQISMGALWSNPECSSDTILKSCVFTSSKHVCVLGYKGTEDAFSYPDYIKENVYRILMEMKALADYVIVDCVSYAVYNILSTVALEIADNVLRVGEASLKSFSFFDSNLAMFTDSRYQTDEHIRILSKIKSFQPKELAKARLSTSYELPYEFDIECSMLEGTLLSRRIGGVYGEQMNKIRTALMEGDELDE